MTKRSVIKTALRLWCITALVLAATGCLRDDLSECNALYTFTVKAYGADSAELTPQDVSDVILYQFDGDLRFVRRIDTELNRSVKLEAPVGEAVHIVAWGNLAGGRQSVPDPQSGEHKDDLFVGLLPDVRSTTYSLPPNDLFRGEMTISPSQQRGEVILPIYREVGSMTVRVRGLKTFTGDDGDDYSVAVRETRSLMNFYGVLSGDETSGRPDGTFVTNFGVEEYYFPPFHLFPANNLIIDIFYAGTLALSVSNDSEGNPINVQKGLLTNVLIDLNVSLEVSLSLTSWGEEKVWKEF